jgi:hypothetical protein
VHDPQVQHAVRTPQLSTSACAHPIRQHGPCQTASSSAMPHKLQCMLICKRCKARTLWSQSQCSLRRRRLHNCRLHPTSAGRSPLVRPTKLPQSITSLPRLLLSPFGSSHQSLFAMQQQFVAIALVLLFQAPTPGHGKR